MKEKHLWIAFAIALALVLIVSLIVISANVRSKPSPELTYVQKEPIKPPLPPAAQPAPAPASVPSAQPPRADTDAASFMMEYVKTPREAMRKYNLKRVRVAGVVVKCFRGSDYWVAQLQTGFAPRKLLCQFRPSEEAKASQLRPDQIVTIEGLGPAKFNDDNILPLLMCDLLHAEPLTPETLAQ